MIFVGKDHYVMSSEIFAAVIVQIAVLWVMTPCSLIDGY
jgi:hypothetical protein